MLSNHSDILQWTERMLTLKYISMGYGYACVEKSKSDHGKVMLNSPRELKRTRSNDTKGTPVNTAEQRLSYQGTQSSVESITIEIQDTPAVYFTFKYTWIFIYMTEGQKKRYYAKVCVLSSPLLNQQHGYFFFQVEVAIRRVRLSVLDCLK